MISRRNLLKLPLSLTLAAQAARASEKESLLRGYPIGSNALQKRLTATTGRKTSLAEVATGRPLFVVGTLRDCPFGLKLQPLYNALADALSKEGIAFAGVTPDAPSVALEHVRRTKTPFPVLCDERSELLRALHIWISFTFGIVDPTGRTVWTSPGASRGTFQAALETLEGWQASNTRAPLLRRPEVMKVLSSAPETSLMGCVFYDGTGQ